jgi:LysM repeat protein
MFSKRLFAVLILTVAFLAVLPLSGTFASSGVADVQAQASPPQETVGPNLLNNPGMEGQYVKQCSVRNGPHWVQVPCPVDYSEVVGSIKQWETAQVPFGWSAWWQLPNNNFDDPNFFNTFPHFCPDRKSTPADCKAWHNPEYRDTLGGPQETGPSRKVAGDNSQKYFTFYSVHEAGLYQVVSGVKPGDRLRFTVFQEAWSTGTNDPYKSDLNQRMNLQIGIDPTGGNNPWSPNIIWTAPAESFDKFTQFVVEAVAKNNIVSVWTKSKPDMPLQHVDVYVDEASLNVVQPARAPAKAPTKSTRVVTSTKIITTTRQITGTDGIVYTAIITQSVVVTKTTPVSTTKPVTPTKTTTPTKPVTSTTSVTGTLPIPASGTYMVVKGDSLSKIARRFGVTVAALIALNKDLITDPNRIEEGWVLKLK